MNYPSIIPSVLPEFSVEEYNIHYILKFLWPVLSDITSKNKQYV